MRLKILAFIVKLFFYFFQKIKMAEVANEVPPKRRRIDSESQPGAIFSFGTCENNGFFDS